MQIVKSMIATAAGVTLMFGAANASGFIKIDSLAGESETSAAAGSGGFDKEMRIESFSFGSSSAATLAKPSGRGAGYANITLKRGFVGREALWSLYQNKHEISSMTLAVEDGGKMVQYELQRAFIKSWSTSGDADDRPTEEVSFYYNKIATTYASTSDGRN